MHCVLVGNYGVGNLGDEALKEYFLTSYPDVRWSVLSAMPTGPGEYHRLPAGIRSLVRLQTWWPTLRLFRSADAIVFGGGSLLTDVESVQACFIWWVHAGVARWVGKPLFLSFQGIGPFRTRVGEWLARDIVRSSQFLSVRDPASAARVKAWHENKKIIQSFDPIISLIQADNRSNRINNLISIIPRHNTGEVLRKRAMAVVGNAAVQILSLQPDHPAEQRACALLRQSLAGPVEVRAVRSLAELTEAVSASSFVLSARYHGALAALATGVPYEVVTQGEGDKLASLVPRPDSQRCRSLVRAGEVALREALQRIGST